MELSDIRDQVRERTGLGASEPLFGTLVLNSLINTAVRRMTVRHDWPWLEQVESVDTVADTQILPSPTNDWRKIVFLRHNDHILSRKSPQKLADWHAKKGKPQHWTEFAGSVYILPTPDGVFPITVSSMLAAEPVLVNDTDEPLVPDWAIDMIIADAAVLVARRLRDKDMEARFYGEREEFIRSIKDETPGGYSGQLPQIPNWRAL